MDLQRYGPWALIVGGSEGVGSAFARKLAADGFKLVLVARKPGPLEEVARELRAGGTEVRIASIDMAQPDAIDRIRAVTDDVEVGFLIYNAGANNTRGDFFELDPEVYRSVIGVTVIGQAECARHFGGLMRARGSGGIILCGSMAGYMGSPTLAPYCASKAFSRVLTETLWAEGQAVGVDVLHLVIGHTATPAMARLGIDLSRAQPPEEVAQEGLDNLANGPVWVVGGEANLQRVTDRSRVADRGAAIRAFATPRREDMPQKN